MRAHVRYLQFRPGKDPDGQERRLFFDARNEDISYRQIVDSVTSQRIGRVAIHKLILSPGVEDADLKLYTRDVMDRLSSHKGQSLVWFAVEHYHTQHPHAHIVVLGADTGGRNVFLSLKDCEHARSFGDDHLKERGLLDRTHERERDKEHETGLQRLIDDLVRQARQIFNKLFTARAKDHDYRREDFRKLTVAAEFDESRFIGDPPDPARKQHAQVARALKEESLRQRHWAEYTKPISILYGPISSKLDEPAQFTWRTPLNTLRELEREYLGGDHLVRKHVTPDDFEKLQRWIKHSWLENKRLQESAATVRRVEVDFDDGTTATYSPDSKLASLLDLYRMQRTGAIFLRDDEEYALEQWITGAAGSNATKKARHLSAKEALKYLSRAYARREAWAINAISKDEHRMLASLIEEKTDRSFSQRESSSIPPKRSLKDRQGKVRER